MLNLLRKAEDTAERTCEYYHEQLDKARRRLDDHLLLKAGAIADGLVREQSKWTMDVWRWCEEDQVKVDELDMTLDPMLEELRAFRNVANLALVEIKDNGWADADEDILARKIKNWFGRHTCFYGNKVRVYRSDSSDSYENVVQWIYDGSEKWIKGVLSEYKSLEVLAAEKLERKRHRAKLAAEREVKKMKRFINAVDAGYNGGGDVKNLGFSL